LAICQWNRCWEYALEVIIEMMILRLYPWYIVFIEYPLKTTCIDWQLCELFVKLFYLYGYSKVVPNRSSCEDTHEY
jgi:hypothetical protein